MLNKKLLLIISLLLSTQGNSQTLPIKNENTLKNTTNNIVKELPIQENITPFIVYDDGKYNLTALAKYSITARLLHVKSYSDNKADISPIDFALGWENMSDNNFLSKVSLDQDNRFLLWKVQSVARPVIHAIENESSNNHLIPANDDIKATLLKAQIGEKVSLKGYLVNLRRTTDDFRWNSSLNRYDTGDGACEIIYVTNATILPNMNDFKENLTAKN